MIPSSAGVHAPRVRVVADIYELMLAIDVQAGISHAELTELRWHVDDGPQPDLLPIGTDDFRATSPLGDPIDPDCEWEDAPLSPLFAERGGALRTGGALVAELVERENPDGWALTVRQELHPDAFYRLRALLDWLGPHSVHAHGTDTPRVVGYLRFHECAEHTPLVLLNGQIRVPDAVEEHTPHWPEQDAQ